MTRILLETKQPIPDFLEHYIPEGEARENLKFEADSDFEELQAGDQGGEDSWGAGNGAGNGDAWGAAEGSGEAWGGNTGNTDNTGAAAETSNDSWGSGGGGGGGW